MYMTSNATVIVTYAMTSKKETVLLFALQNILLIRASLPFSEEVFAPKNLKHCSRIASLLGECGSFGVNKMLPICRLEEFGQNLVSFKSYKKIIVDMNKFTMQPQKRKSKVYKETTSQEFVGGTSGHFAEVCKTLHCTMARCTMPTYPSKRYHSVRCAFC
jgi:hypothetical protein